jgi:competence protein ComGC
MGELETGKEEGFGLMATIILAMIAAAVIIILMLMFIPQMDCGWLCNLGKAARDVFKVTGV